MSRKGRVIKPLKEENGLKVVLPPSDMPLEFSTSEERAQWIIKNAKYFTAIRRVNLRNERHEYPSLAAAREGAGRMAQSSNCRYLIYAVGPMDYATYVETVAPKE